MATYSLVWASSRASQSRPRAVEPVSRSDFASTMEKIVRMTPEAIGSRISTRPVKRGCRRSSQSRGASESETSFSL